MKNHLFFALGWACGGGAVIVLTLLFINGNNYLLPKQSWEVTSKDSRTHEPTGYQRKTVYDHDGKYFEPVENCR